MLRELNLTHTLHPPGYDINAHYNFYMDASGHTIENCYAVKNHVQDLIESKVVTFTPTCPNVGTNLMMTH